MEKQLLFYDIEVFKEDCLVVFKDIDKKLVKAYWNKFTGLGEFIKDKIIVGYNNYHYDDYILTAMIDEYSPYRIKKINDDIIQNRHQQRLNSDIESLDCFQQIDVSMPSLKKIEGNMGKMILESSVDFTIDRALTDEEKQEVFEYCCYDVDTTIDIYKMREHTYFNTKNRLLNMLNNDKAKRWNTTTISSNLLLKKPLNKWSGLRVPEKMFELVPAEVKDLWFAKSKDMDNSKIKSITIQEFDNSIQFGFGGLHGAHNTLKKVENVKLLDVASMYPTTIETLNVLGNATELYSSMKKQRLEVKHKDKPLSDALKLVLNSVYGNLKNQYSTLNNPQASLSVCIYGQIALYELCKRISPFITIININTDGVAFTADSELYKSVVEDWENEFKFKLEEDKFDLWIQKDVNNYVAKIGDKIKTKGGDVSRYSDNKYFSNNSIRIVDIAIVENLINGTDVIDTIINNLDKPELFQYILQAGNTYQGTFDNENNKYNKVNRVFAVKKNGVLLQKKRLDGGLVRFPDTPDIMRVWNHEVSDIDLDKFKKALDVNWYYQLIKKKLEAWK